MDKEAKDLLRLMKPTRRVLTAKNQAAAADEAKTAPKSTTKTKPAE